MPAWPDETCMDRNAYNQNNQYLNSCEQSNASYPSRFSSCQEKNQNFKIVLSYVAQGR